MQIFLRLSKYIKYRWLSFVIGSILSIISAGLSIYAPIIASKLIDQISQGFKQKLPLDTNHLIHQLTWYFIITCLGILAAYLSYMILAKASNDITRMIRDQAHAHMQQLPVSYFDDKPAGKISARIVNDTESLKQNFYMNFMNQIFVNLVTVIGVYLAIFQVSSEVGLWLLGLIPVFIGWQWVYMKWVQPVNLRWRDVISELNSQIAEMIQGIEIIQVFQRQEKIINSFEATNQDWLATRNEQIKIDMALSWNFSQMLERLVLLGIMLFVGTKYTQGVFNMSIGTLYLLIEYAGRLFDPITMIVRLLAFVQQAIASGTRVFELLDTPVEEDSQEQIQVQEGKVEFKDVNFAYKDQQWVLNHINLTANKGETIGIVGHTGSGKSSIINLLFRFYDPQHGEILIDQQNIRDYQRESLREHMGIVLQEPYLFTGTIADNITMRDPNITEGMAREALIKVGGERLLSQLELGINELVIEKGQSLSSGERQLISFARALASNPKILILDEATSHVDSETEAMIQRAMDIVKEGRTTFIVAHRLSTIQNADQIIVLDKGRIIEQGNHQTLMQANGQYAEMYRLQGIINA